MYRPAAILDGVEPFDGQLKSVSVTAAGGSVSTWGTHLSIPNATVFVLQPDASLTVDVRPFGDSRISRANIPAGGLHIVQAEPGTEDGMEYRLAISLRNSDITLSGRPSTLRRGDILMFDLACEADICFPAATQWLALSLPRVVLADRLAGAPPMPPMLISGRTPTASLFRSCLFEIWRSGAWLSADRALALADAKVDLAMQAIEDALALSVDPIDVRVGLLLRASTVIRQGLSNARLSGDMVAKALGISTSALSAALGQLSAREVIRRHRLLAARRMLRSSVHTRLSISEIARKVGMANLSHFSDAYSQAFGMPPSASRATQ